MDLTKLFETQKILRDRIDYKGEDRFNKLVLALLVELGECANEWRGFKFWSKDQEPRKEVLIPCDSCGGSGRSYSGYCGSCHGGYVGKENPLLEEYVDGLHFILDLCIELGMKAEQLERFIDNRQKKIGSMEHHFGYLYYGISELMETGSIQYRAYKMLHISNAFLGLGYRLGFTWEEIEQAYYDKNKINHHRQDVGY